MRFASADSTVPTWLGLAYLASNMTLNSLNCYWFYKMIQALAKRFQPAAPPSAEKLEEKEETVRGATSALKGEIPPEDVRMRRGKDLKTEPELDVVM